MKHENQHNPNLPLYEVNAQPFRHGSLFSGIGGFELAAEWMGWENVFHCEWNEFGKKVLKYYWPKAISYDDITKTDFTIHRGNIDILTGGFPCQPYSSAGKRKGKEDERHLWPQMLRAIREIQPGWIVGENVRGLTTWNGGLVFNEVQTDLEAEGYEVLPFLLPASGVNAPHERYRIVFIAYSNEYSKGSSGKSRSIKSSRRRNDDEPEEWRSKTKLNPGSFEFLRITSDTLHNGSQGSIYAGENRKKGRENENGHIKERMPFNRRSIQFENFPTQSPVRGRDDGISGELVGITVSKHRNESIKAFGNAVVPPMFYQIFNAISVHEAEYGWR